MIAIALLLVGLAPAAMTATMTAGTTPGSIPGLESAELRPGWVAKDGTRVIALDLRLEPGWKTYWRSPGEAGMVPVFDWSGSKNLAQATPVWPTPGVFLSAGMRTLGYQDRLVLPIRLTPQEAGQPVNARLSLDFGICRNVCVPAHLDLGVADSSEGPDPVIKAALANVPAAAPSAAQCSTVPDGEGVTLNLRVPAGDGGKLPDAAVEVAGTHDSVPVWVSSAMVAAEGASLNISADIIPDAEGYVFDPGTVRLTLVSNGKGVEFDGCTPA